MPFFTAVEEFKNEVGLDPVKLLEDIIHHYFELKHLYWIEPFVQSKRDFPEYPQELNG